MSPEEPTPEAPQIEPEAPKIVGYCRACGKPLDETNVRNAHGTIYCEEHIPMTQTVPPIPIPAAAPAVDVAPAPDLAAVPDLAAAPTPAPEPMRLTERPQEDLDLIARGIARAIAAATAHGFDQPRRR